MMLIVTTIFITPGAIQNPVPGGEITRQADGPLVTEPGFKTLLCFLMIPPPVEVHDHHARFVSVSAVVKGANAGKPSSTVRLALAVDQQMTRVCSIKLVEHRLWGDEPRAFLE